jgi:hypothetical protein
MAGLMATFDKPQWALACYTAGALAEVQGRYPAALASHDGTGRATRAVQMDGQVHTLGYVCQFRR